MSNVYERLLEFSASKGFKNLNDFSNYVGFKSPEKLYRLGRNEKNKPSYDILFQIANKFEDLNLNWLIKGTGVMTFETGKEDPETNPVADSITRLIKTISALTDTAIKENIALLKEQLYQMAEDEKDMREKVNYIYNKLLKTELSKDIQKTIDKVKE